MHRCRLFHPGNYLQEGSRVHMCLYDLQKAFDSVEILLLSFPGWHQFKNMAPFA